MNGTDCGVDTGFELTDACGVGTGGMWPPPLSRRALACCERVEIVLLGKEWRFEQYYKHSVS